MAGTFYQRDGRITSSATDNPAMTDPTPTRAEVEALSIAGYRHGYPRSYGTCWEYLDPSRKDLSELEWEPLVTKSQAAEVIRALRERAEAAERDRLLMAQKYDEEHPDPALMATIIMQNIENRFVIEDLQAALTAARRAEAAAWNDAIEAVLGLQRHSLNFCDRMEATTDGAWLHEDAIRAIRRAAPTEGEA